MDSTEALAEVWASFDGKHYDFQAGKTAKSIMDYGGHYAGYMAEAAEMLRRLEALGFVVVRKA